MRGVVHRCLGRTGSVWCLHDSWHSQVYLGTGYVYEVRGVTCMIALNGAVAYYCLEVDNNNCGDAYPEIIFVLIGLIILLYLFYRYIGR